jgi:hypothetical protein
MRGRGGPTMRNRMRVEQVFAEQKGSDGALYQNYLDRPGNDQDRNGQSRLQRQTLIFLRKIAIA